MGFVSRYGLLGSIKMAVNLVRTKIVLKNARIIRFPIDIRGRKFLEVKKGFTTGHNCRIEAFSVDGTAEKTLVIGQNVQINDLVHITAGKSVFIGNNVLIASKVYISDTSHGEYKSDSPSLPYQAPAERQLITSPVIIGDNVWLGDGVCVLPGVSIGFGSIIGSNAVVTKSIPPMCIAAGNPAKVFKRFDQDTKTWISTKFTS